MRLAVVVGTRPQFIKLAALLPALRRQGLPYFVVNTGQHYDAEMSHQLLRELGVGSLDEDLKIRACAFDQKAGAGTWSQMIAAGKQKLVPILKEQNATHVVVIGDSNPAMVGAQAAVELDLPLVHCEAGLRNGDDDTWEEMNRAYVDHRAALHFCSTERDRAALHAEVPASCPNFTGDLLVDVHRKFRRVRKRPRGWPRFGLHGRVCLFTIHRMENARRPRALRRILEHVAQSWDGSIVWPVHPGLKAFAEQAVASLPTPLAAKFHLLGPATYTELNYIKSKSKLVITDSVGLQVESYLWKIPCIALRDHIEHKVLEQCGATVVLPLAEATDARIAAAIRDALAVAWQYVPGTLFGSAGIADQMAELIFIFCHSLHLKAAAARAAAFDRTPAAPARPMIAGALNWLGFPAG